MMTKRPTRLAAIVGAAIMAAGATLASAPAQASEPFIGEIRMVGFNFAPRGWAFCDGQLLAISQNTALFSLLGTTYGGDGRTTFALPDLRGRSAVHPGTGAGLSTIRQGERRGAETHTLTPAQMPSHTHGATATAHAYETRVGGGDADGPAGNVWSKRRRTDIYSTRAPNVTMSSAAVTVSVENAGGNQPFSIRDPYLGIYHVIATQGLFPSRN